MTYRLADPTSYEVEKKLEKYEPLLRQLLYNRGIKDTKVAETFLNPNYDNDLHDPFLMRDMDLAVDRILKAIEKNERIAIYSDYDCDGIPGAVVLHDFFKKINYENFINYIPHRHYEGYGFNIGAVDKLAKDRINLIITIDCGTSDIEAVDLANTLDIDVIITDHHEIPEELPEAIVFLNPKLDDEYPFGDLCGAGVVYKLVQALITKGSFDIHEGWEKWLLDMVGVATVADMVPLIDENRVLAHYGLTVLRKSRRPGLQHLFRITKANQQHLTEDDIGFTIGPRINAASRMDVPEDAFNMLIADDEGEADMRVKHLEKLNNERKGMVASMTKEIKKRMKTLEKVLPVLVLGNPDWRPSLVGLAAGTLADEYKRPAFVWGRDGNGIIKGSCRSGGGTSVIKLMEEIKGHLLEYGGHHNSGGFAVEQENIHTLGELLNKAQNILGKKALVNDEVIVDSELTLDDINESLLKTLISLAPYGVGNPKPLFKFSNITPSGINSFGKTKIHTKLIFDLENKKIEAIAFFKNPEDFSITPKVGSKLTLLAHVEQSYFMNRQQTRLRIVDIV